MSRSIFVSDIPILSVQLDEEQPRPTFEIFFGNPNVCGTHCFCGICFQKHERPKKVNRFHTIRGNIADIISEMLNNIGRDTVTLPKPQMVLN